jgi:hypothetical protein
MQIALMLDIRPSDTLIAEGPVPDPCERAQLLLAIRTNFNSTFEGTTPGAKSRNYTSKTASDAGSETDWCDRFGRPSAHYIGFPAVIEEPVPIIEWMNNDAS